MQTSMILNCKQVAQLSQKDGVNLDTFCINIECYCKILHNIAFLGHPMGASGAIQALHLKVLTQKNFVAEFRRENISFTRKTAN